MRPVQVQLKSSSVERVLEHALEHGAHSPLSVRAERRRATGEEADEPWSLVFLNLPNDRVGAFVHAVRAEVEEAEFVLLPVGALPLNTPIGEVSERVRDVSRLSTVELVVASLQSVGAWPGMLLFSALAGLIGAYGLIFDVSYMLVAAMLVNPMGAPALVSVIALTVGDAKMMRRGALRFFISLVLQATAALLLGYAYDLRISTGMMELVTSLSLWSALVAMAAGAAGAQAQVKSARDSLVSGTAAGFMVAAALAPPAAVLGLSVPLGRWDYTALMLFLLALQYLCIAVGGWIVLSVLGVRPGDPTLGRGRARVRTLLAAVLVVLTLGMVAWQTQLGPRFRKADASRMAIEIGRDAAERTAGVALVESSARFSRADLRRYPEEALIFELLVEKTAPLPDSAVAEALRRTVLQLAAERLEQVVPLVEVTVLPLRSPAPQ